MWPLKLSIVDGKGKDLSHSIGALMDPSADLHVSKKKSLAPVENRILEPHPIA